jgi:hypothetical protein
MQWLVTGIKIVIVINCDSIAIITISAQHCSTKENKTNVAFFGQNPEKNYKLIVPSKV